VLARHFDWRVSVPTYLAAAYVASSRIHEHRHYFSDVVFGAALGIAAGHSIASPRAAVTCTPVATPTKIGFMVVYAH
jgi:membrane-associated phospholipid phosphatase